MHYDDVAAVANRQLGDQHRKVMRRWRVPTIDLSPRPPLSGLGPDRLEKWTVGEDDRREKEEGNQTREKPFSLSKPSNGERH